MPEISDSVTKIATILGWLLLVALTAYGIAMLLATSDEKNPPLPDVSPCIYALGGYNYTETKLDGNNVYAAQQYGIYRYTTKFRRWESLKETIPTKRTKFSTASHMQKIYVVGGENEEGQSEVRNDCYDRETNTWTTLAPMALARSMAACSFVTESDGNSYLYVVGGQLVQQGQNGLFETNSVERYDPRSNSWSSRHAMTTKRSSCTATAVVHADGKSYLYVYGSTNIETMLTGERYDPEEDTWTSVATMPDLANTQPGCVAGFVAGSSFVSIPASGGGNGDCLYALGGLFLCMYPFPRMHAVVKRVIKYDPEVDGWTPAEFELPSPRHGFQCALLADEKDQTQQLYLLGGFEAVVPSGESGKIPSTHHLDRYDFDNAIWKSCPSMPTGLSGFGIGVLPAPTNF